MPELMIEDKRGYEDMPQNAEDILALYANNQYPVPVIGIAKKFGFKVFDTDLQDNQLSGFIVVDPKWKDVYGSEKIIMVNKNDSSGHKQFDSLMNWLIFSLTVKGEKRTIIHIIRKNLHGKGSGLKRMTGKWLQIILRRIC